MSHNIFRSLFLITFFSIIISAGASYCQDSTASKSSSRDSVVKSPDSLKTNAKDSTLQSHPDSSQVIKKDTASSAAEDSSIITIPAGTNLVIRLTGSISTAYPPGSSVTGILESDLVFNEKLIASSGQIVMGKIIDSRPGTRLTFMFTSLQLENGTRDIKTIRGGVEVKSDKSANILGNVSFSGGPFAGVTSGNGAPVTGGLAGLKSGKDDIQIPAGTIIEIPLEEPLIIK